MTATCIAPLDLEGVIQAIGTDRASPPPQQNIANFNLSPRTYAHDMYLSLPRWTATTKHFYCSSKLLEHEGYLHLQRSDSSIDISQDSYT